MTEPLKTLQTASELRYRRLFETAQDGILILDFKSGQIEDANPFLMHLLGYSREDEVFRGEDLDLMPLVLRERA